MDPAELRSALVDLNALMVSDLAALWRAVDGQDVEFLRDALQAEVPGVVDPYLAAAGDITADWYEAQDPELAYVARPAALVDEGQLQATARWAAGTVLTRTPVSPLDLLAGSMQRALFNESRETIVQNSAAEPGATHAVALVNARAIARSSLTRGSRRQRDWRAAGRCRGSRGRRQWTWRKAPRRRRVREGVEERIRRRETVPGGGDGSGGQWIPMAAAFGPARRRWPTKSW